ncbi:MAG: ABC transporter permease [Muribaculaceae bacterium]|nr:ABC transporter permease [Muribaculaceae bacterium]
MNKNTLKSFNAFVIKETRHLLRDPRTLLIALLMPVVQMLLFGFAISTDVNSINIAVSDPYGHHDTGKLICRMEANPLFRFTGYLNPDETVQVLTDGEASAVISFTADHSADIAVDGSNPIIARSAAAYVSAMLSDASPGIGVRILYNPRLLSAYNFVPGIMGLIFILICAMLTSVSIVREKESGTIEVLLVSPIRPGMIYIGKLIPYFVLSFIDLTAILLIAHYALEVPLSGSMSALIALSAIYIITALGLGLCISTMVNTQMIALLISGMVLMMPVIMLSGMLFPIENMPAPLQWLSAIVPARWFISATRKLMIQGLGWHEVATEAMILAGMMVAVITLAVKRFNPRLK